MHTRCVYFSLLRYHFLHTKKKTMSCLIIYRKAIRVCTLLSVFIIAIPGRSDAQIITTIAGTGTAGYSGDGGAATMAELNVNNCTTFDDAGNMYITDAYNYRIRQVGTDGIISTYAGTGVSGFTPDGFPATASGVSEPFGITTDTHNNIFFADFAQKRIRKIDPSGIMTTVAGTGVGGITGDGGPATDAELFGPEGIAVAPTGEIYISNPHSIRKIDASGIITTIAGSGITYGFSGDGGPATAALLSGPAQIAIDGAGNILFADAGNCRIRKIDGTGTITTIAGSGPSGVTSGLGGFSGDGGPATNALLNTPSGLAVDDAGNIYIADQYNYRIRKIDASGTITTIAGSGATGVGVGGYSGDNGPATSALLKQPYGVSISCAGNVYISDRSNNCVRVVSYDQPPVFTLGASQHMTVCKNAAAVSTDTLLAITDADAGQAETWSLVVPAAHGTATGAYSGTSTGGSVLPVGLSYTPAPGYTGNDSFAVQVTDCGYVAGYTVVYVTVEDCSLSAPLTSVATGLQVWPNPASGTVEVNLALNTAEAIHMSLTNLLGVQVKEATTTANTPTVLQLDVPDGIYFVPATGASGQGVAKVVVRH
jgi:sugar lactone lactonase YvrE